MHYDGTSVELRCDANPVDCGPQPGPNHAGGTWRCTDAGARVLGCSAGYVHVPTAQLGTATRTLIVEVLP